VHEAEVGLLPAELEGRDGPERSRDLVERLDSQYVNFYAMATGDRAPGT
jgi:hypothetical protein